jgi:hypothetical protein
MTIVASASVGLFYVAMSSYLLARPTGAISVPDRQPRQLEGACANSFGRSNCLCLACRSFLDRTLGIFRAGQDIDAGPLTDRSTKLARSGWKRSSLQAEKPVSQTAQVFHHAVKGFEPVGKGVRRKLHDDWRSMTTQRFLRTRQDRIFLPINIELDEIDAPPPIWTARCRESPPARPWSTSAGREASGEDAEPFRAARTSKFPLP